MILKIYLIISILTFVMWILYTFSEFNRIMPELKIKLMLRNKNISAIIIAFIQMILISFMPIINFIFLILMIFCQEMIMDSADSKVRNIKGVGGGELIESWRIEKLTVEQAYYEQENLIKQGWFTTIYNPDEENIDEFGIIVYGKV